MKKYLLIACLISLSFSAAGCTTNQNILCRLKGTRPLNIDPNGKYDVISEQITVNKDGSYMWDFCVLDHVQNYFHDKDSQSKLENPSPDIFTNHFQGSLPQPIVIQLTKATKKYRRNLMNLLSLDYLFEKQDNIPTLNYDCRNSISFYPPDVTNLMTFLENQHLNKNQQPPSWTVVQQNQRSRSQN
jgi:hypothetical protein